MPRKHSLSDASPSTPSAPRRKSSSARRPDLAPSSPHSLKTARSRSASSRPLRTNGFEASIMDERLREPNGDVDMVEDALEDLVNLPIADELISRRARLRVHPPQADLSRSLSVSTLADSAAGSSRETFFDAYLPSPLTPQDDTSALHKGDDDTESYVLGTVTPGYIAYASSSPSSPPNSAFNNNFDSLLSDDPDDSSSPSPRTPLSSSISSVTPTSKQGSRIPTRRDIVESRPTIDVPPRTSNRPSPAGRQPKTPNSTVSFPSSPDEIDKKSSSPSSRPTHATRIPTKSSTNTSLQPHLPSNNNNSTPPSSSRKSRQRNNSSASTSTKSRQPATTKPRPSNSSIRTNPPSKHRKPSPSKPYKESSYSKYPDYEEYDADSIPPWALNPAPIVYKVDAAPAPGSLDALSASSSSAGVDANERSWENMIIPTVARRIAQQRMMEGDPRFSKVDGFITEWDKDGKPLNRIYVNPAQSSPSASNHNIQYPDTSQPTENQDSDIPGENRVQITGENQNIQKQQESTAPVPIVHVTDHVPPSQGPPIPQRKEVWQEEGSSSPDEFHRQQTTSAAAATAKISTTSAPAIELSAPNSARKEKSKQDDDGTHGKGCKLCIIM